MTVLFHLIQHTKENTIQNILLYFPIIGMKYLNSALVKSKEFWNATTLII